MVHGMVTLRPSLRIKWSGNLIVFQDRRFNSWRDIPAHLVTDEQIDVAIEATINLHQQLEESRQTVHNV